MLSPLCTAKHALSETDPHAVWRLSKPEAIARIDAASETGRTIRAFYAALLAHYAGGETVASALPAMDAGLALLDAAAAWYRGMRGAISGG